MATYTQADQPIRVDTELGEDALLLSGFAGQEAVSEPFTFHLDLLSEDPAIDPASLLRTSAAIAFDLPDGGRRHLHGRISRFVQYQRHDDLTEYRAELVPWLWFLSLSWDCRIFQGRTVPEIVEEVFQDQGYSDFAIECKRSYPARDYCVQYRETHLDFVHRLLEEEGIFYFFRHTDSEHVLVLTDDNSSVQPCEGSPSARMRPEALHEEDVIISVETEHSVHPGEVTLRDYDYLQPSLSLETSIPGRGQEEVYDFPGRYRQLDDGERYARIRLEAEEALHHVVRGAGTCRGFRSGSRFDLEEHHRPDANRTYMLLEILHKASVSGYRAGDTEGGAEYRNTFLAIPHDVPYRPRARTPRPVVHGAQTAVVVGKSGEEIWVDEHGRVKVQFFWDRYGKGDEDSSCWVRVSSSWAGKGWGAMQIPRIGQEVVVDFLEGDPDRPIITGRVYNAEQPPPYDLPGEQTRSGIRSRSSKNGDRDQFNEIRFEDKKGAEEIYLHAEKDLRTVVENSEERTVGNRRSTEVEADDTKRILQGSEETTIDQGDQTVELGQGSQEVSIKMGDRKVKLDMGKSSHEAMQKIELKVGQSSVVIDQKGVTVKGLQVEIDGQVQTKVSGVVTEVTGQGMLKARGGVTMIN